MRSVLSTFWLVPALERGGGEDVDEAQEPVKFPGVAWLSAVIWAAQRDACSFCVYLHTGNVNVFYK